MDLNFPWFDRECLRGRLTFFLSFCFWILTMEHGVFPTLRQDLNLFLKGVSIPTLLASLSPALSLMPPLANGLLF